jgi:hypothetical protein
MLCVRASIPRIAYTHNGTAISAKLPPESDLVASPIEWRSKKVLLLVRDPRDILVSAYFHSHFRKNFYEGTISDFIRHPYVGVEKILCALNRWHDNRCQASSFEVMSYEEMHRDPRKSLRRSLIFAGILQPDSRLVEEAVKFADLENLQQLERANYFKSNRKMEKSEDPRGRKARAGKPGGYEDHFSESDLHFISNAKKRIGNPFKVGCGFSSSGRVAWVSAFAFLC